MAVNGTSSEYLLPCGRDVDEVWSGLGEPVDVHERDCPHCRATRGSLLVLRDVTRELADDETEPSRDLTGRIMAAVRADLRRHDLLPLPTPEPGSLEVSAQAVAAVVRFAADGVAGVRARRCRVTAGAAAGALAVELNLAVSYHGFVRHLLDDVRDRVESAVGARIGVRLERLDLVLDDLYEDG
ncbi:MAG TPA: Asp23/Gls24 family envelope stress response protein [Actinophytocola sp.]|nr:Asp23/Gls24 family envelope stress response protein [Actinophytocola sp.]